MTSKIFLLFFTFWSLNLLAQDNPWYFSLNMGKSFPLGAFSQNSLQQLNSGFAQNGFALTLESDYSFNDNFSLKGMVLLNTNTLERLPLFTNLNNRLNQAVTPGSNDQQYASLTVNPWVSNSLLIGPVYSLLLKNWKWDFYASGGLAVIYLPQARLIYQNPANNWIYLDRNTNPKHINFGFGTGTSLRFPISEKFDFRLGLNYFYSKAKQKFVQQKITTTQNNTVIQQLSAQESSVPIQIISATVGLVYYLRY